MFDADRTATSLAMGPLSGVVRPTLQLIEFQLWRVRGGQGPPPAVAKQRLIKEFARRFRLQTLVESGTYRGDTVWAVRHAFREIHSIELDPSLYQLALRRFRRFNHIHLHQGDSADVLRGLVQNLQGPALFWLDGHYSGGITAKGILETPVKAELSHIFSDRIPDHVALIDDARIFTGYGDYPSIEQLRGLLAQIRPGLSLSSADDVIRVHR